MEHAAAHSLSLLARLNETIVPATGFQLQDMLMVGVLFFLWAALEVIDIDAKKSEASTHR